MGKIIARLPSCLWVLNLATTLFIGSIELFMENKKSFDISFWFSILFIGAMLFFAQKVIFLTKESNSSGIMNIEQIPIEMKLLSGSTPNQGDDSMQIGFLTPNGMVEDENIARKIGVYKFYRSAERKVNHESVIAISFLKKGSGGFNLREFILSNTQNLIRAFPNQKPTLGLITLNPEVVQKFEYIGMPYAVVSYFIKGVADPDFSCAIFYFETPGGFWSINWTAPKRLLERETREKNIFLGLIKFMMIGVANPNTKSYEVHM